MSYKPMPLRIYSKYIKIVGWALVKGSIDWKLLNENGNFICSIKIAHSKSIKDEVVASFIFSLKRDWQD